MVLHPKTQPHAYLFNHIFFHQSYSISPAYLCTPRVLICHATWSSYIFTEASPEIHKCTDFCRHCMSASRKPASPWGAWIKSRPCELSEWNRLTLIYCPANCFFHCLASFPLLMAHSLAHSLFELWCIEVLPMHPSVAPPKTLLVPPLSRSLLLYLRLPLSLTAAVLQCCSLLWLVCRNGVNPFLPREWGCTLLFSCRSLHPAFPSILRWKRSQSLRRCFGFYLNTVSELHVFIHIWCRALWWKWICVYWEKDTKRMWLCYKPSELSM